MSERFTVDMENQIIKSVFRYEVFKNGSLEHSIVGDFPLRWYWEDELRALLHAAGFADVEVFAGSPLYKKGSCFVLRSS